MKRRSCVTVLAAGIILGALNCVAELGEVDKLVQEANDAIAAAEMAVEDARVAIENGKQLVAQIPSDSAYIGEVRKMLQAASENWSAAVASLAGAKESAAKIATASSLDIARDYKLLSTVSAKVAFSGAKVVQTGLFFVDSVAKNNNEALGIIRLCMQDSLAASSQVRFNYDRVKQEIAKKYSN